MKLGYIKKEKDSQDARVYRLSLTQQGKELRGILEEVSERLLEKMYVKFTSEEKRQLMTLLMKIPV